MQRTVATFRRGDLFRIEGEELKHIFARRWKVGQKVEVFWEGRLFLCVLESISKKGAVCRILEEISTRPAEPYVYLYQCVPVEIGKMDFIVEKVSEVGAYQLTPLLSSRSFQNLQALEKRYERWRRIAFSSFKQCGRPIPLEIAPVTHLEDLKCRGGVCMVLDSFGGEIWLSEVNLKDVKEVHLVVGPEGGFSEKEVQLLREKGFLPVRLRPYTLRSETAAVLAVGLVMNFSSPPSPTSS
ncbi:RsmE family RNA methyltransferase [Thermocrinis albus]|nr:16S rRNA (uracil(1498)-N(3))-methyltransferase [Thermocrinis albus]